MIFEHLPKPSDAKRPLLDLDRLIADGRTYQYADLPDRLWAATGLRLPNATVYHSFGRLRNAIQHFAVPNRNVAAEAIEFVFQVIDPFINQCWGLFAIDYNEDYEPYVYFVAGLIRRGVSFLVSPGVIAKLRHTHLDWPKGNLAYRKEMEKRIEAAKKLHS